MAHVHTWNTSLKMPPSGSAPYSTLGLGAGDSSALTALQAMGSGRAGGGLVLDVRGWCLAHPHYQRLARVTQQVARLRRCTASKSQIRGLCLASSLTYAYCWSRLRQHPQAIMS